MRKKIIATAAALVLGTLMLAGCSQQPAEEPADEVAVESVEALEGEAAADDSEQPAATEGQSSGSTSKPSSGSSGSTSGGSVATTPSTGGSGNSGSSGSSGTAAEPSTPPAHEHSWTHHPAEYVDEPVYAARIVCSCGQVFSTQGEWSAHNKALVLQDPASGHSYSVRDVQVGTEKVLVSGEYWTCSCGATK